jgi:PAS domain-containing protein
VLDRMTDAFLALDAAGRVTYANPAAERTLGCRLEEALGQEVGKCLAESARSLFEQNIDPGDDAGRRNRDLACVSPQITQGAAQFTLSFQHRSCWPAGLRAADPFYTLLSCTYRLHCGSS